MRAPILVTGGTGTLGRLVVPRLRDTGRDVRVLARHGLPDADGVRYVTGDLTTGEGVDSALDGVATIVHCAGNATGDAVMTRTLTRAARRAGTPHLIYISVVGADRIPVRSRLDRNMFGYYAAKREAELTVADSGVPWTTLRATQFHDLLLTAARALAKSPVVPAPAGFRFQPVDADEVAARLVELVLGGPAGLVPELGGPRVYTATELFRGYLHAAGRRRPVVSVPLPGGAAGALKAGANLTPDHADGRRTWEDFLADRVGAAAAAGRAGAGRPA